MTTVRKGRTLLSHANARSLSSSTSDEQMAPFEIACSIVPLASFVGVCEVCGCNFAVRSNLPRVFLAFTLLTVLWGETGRGEQERFVSPVGMRTLRCPVEACPEPCLCSTSQVASLQKKTLLYEHSRKKRAF